MTWLRSLWEDFKAWRRGERRVAPRGVMRGRIYEKKGRVFGRVNHLPPQAGRHNVNVKPTVAVQVTKIHADGTREEIGTVPGTLTVKPDKRG